MPVWLLAFIPGVWAPGAAQTWPAHARESGTGSAAPACPARLSYRSVPPRRVQLAVSTVQRRQRRAAPCMDELVARQRASCRPAASAVTPVSLRWQAGRGGAPGCRPATAPLLPPLPPPGRLFTAAVPRGCQTLPIASLLQRTKAGAKLAVPRPVNLPSLKKVRPGTAVPRGSDSWACIAG